ncbi:MAG: extracellular solute-binding protein [Treponema sp.]|nr:extracellular solute-binding protein [Treponema sp.]
MKRLVSFAVLLAALLAAVFFAACSKKSDAGSAQKVTPAPGPLGKYNPPLTVQFARSTSASDRYDEGYSLEHNEWTIENEQQLGIITKYLWTADASQYNQKMAASIATGDLADIFSVNQEQFDMLKRNNLIWDLTDVYNEYASDIMKNAMDSDPKQTNLAKVNGRLMAIPQLGHTLDTQVLWVRQDWIEKLGLPEPKTLADVKRIAEAFVTRDPDGNGVNDTMGLVFQSEPFSNLTIGAFLAAYHGYHTGWLKDSSGNLVYAGIQPEVKQGLAAMNEWYNQGLITKEWVNLSWDECVSIILSGRAGIFMGAFWFPTNLPQFEQMQPGGKFYAYPNVSADSQPAKIMTDIGLSYYVVNKKFQNPEALIKLANYMYEFYYGTSNIRDQRPYLFNSVSQGYENWIHNTINNVWLPNKNFAYHLTIREVIETGNTSLLNSESRGYYDWIMKYRNGDNSEGWPWVYNFVFGPDKGASETAIETYVNNDLILLNEYIGSPTETMITRQSSLNDLRNEVYTKIIIGELPVSAFDTFVADWKRQGGDDITKEVNAWYKENR